MDEKEGFYAHDAVVVETAEAVAAEQGRKQRGDRVVVVVQNHQVGVDAAQDALLLFVHVACRFEQMDHLRYQLHALPCHLSVHPYVIVAVDCEKLVDENACEVVIDDIFRIHFRLTHLHTHFLSNHDTQQTEHCTWR